MAHFRSFPSLPNLPPLLLVNFLLIAILTCTQTKELDNFGIEKLLLSSNPSSTDYYSNFESLSRNFTSVNVDPGNPSCWARGNNAQFEIDSSNGIMTMTGDSPRYYCLWNHTNIEMTAYGYRGTEITTKSTQGLVLVASSDHNYYSNDYCKARGYYFRYYNTGSFFLHNFPPFFKGPYVHSVQLRLVQMSVRTQNRLLLGVFDDCKYL